MSSVNLIGSEDVQRAGYVIASAAQQMQAAANQNSESTQRLERALNEFISNFSSLVERIETAYEKKAGA